MKKIPTDIEVARVANPELEAAGEVFKMAQAWAVTSHASLSSTVSAIAEIKKQADQVNEKRKSFVDPLKKVVDDINAFFKPALDCLIDAEYSLKGLVSGYLDNCEAARKVLLSEVEDAPEAERGEKIVQAGTLIPPKIAGLSVRETMACEVIDEIAAIQWVIAQGNLSLLHIDKKAIINLAKAYGGFLEIPGVKISKDKTIAITVDKIRED